MDTSDNMTSKHIGNKDLLSCSRSMANYCSQPIKEEINFKFLNLGLNIRYNILCSSFEGKEKLNDPTNFHFYVPCKSSQLNTQV